MGPDLVSLRGRGMTCVMGGQGRAGGAGVYQSQSQSLSNAQYNWKCCHLNGIPALSNTLANILHVPAPSVLALGTKFLFYEKIAHVQYIPNRWLTVRPSNNSQSMHPDPVMHLSDSSPLCPSHQLDTTLSPSLRLRVMMSRPHARPGRLPPHELPHTMHLALFQMSQNLQRHLSVPAL